MDTYGQRYAVLARYVTMTGASLERVDLVTASETDALERAQKLAYSLSLVTKDRTVAAVETDLPRERTRELLRGDVAPLWESDPVR